MLFYFLGRPQKPHQPFLLFRYLLNESSSLVDVFGGINISLHWLTKASCEHFSPTPLQYSWASLVAQMVKNLPANAGVVVLIPGLGRSPGGGHDNPLQCSCLENPHGQRSLAGYSPWSRKELGTTEKLSTTQHSPTSHSVKSSW